MIRVMVVDDHPIVRQGLVSVLGDEDDLEVVGAAGSGREAVARVQRLQPDVVDSHDSIGTPSTSSYC